MQQQQPAAHHVVICVLTGQSSDVTLMTAVSMLRLQQTLLTFQTPIEAEVHFVRDFNDALHLVHRAAKGPHTGALIVEGKLGFDPRFVLRALATTVPLVVGVYPLPVVDWQRITTRPSDEPPEEWGNVYNVTPVHPGRPADANGYLEVSREASLGLLWLRAGVLQQIAERHPETVQADQSTAFGLPGVSGGRVLNPHHRFLDLYGGTVMADPDSGATSSGPTEFGGCVGARSVLR